jgi:hypothetical protein
MDSISVPLLSRRARRGVLAQKLNHAIPAMGLLAAGVQALAEGARGLDLALAAVEIITSAMLVITIGREMRELHRRQPSRGHHAHGVDWIDIWAAGVLFAEAAERWHLNHHLARPTILTGLVTLGLACFINDCRATATPPRRQNQPGWDYIGGKPFRTFSASWPDLASILTTSTTVEVERETAVCASILAISKTPKTFARRSKRVKATLRCPRGSRGGNRRPSADQPTPGSDPAHPSPTPV